jgi:hypothetical protein
MGSYANSCMGFSRTGGGRSGNLARYCGNWLRRACGCALLIALGSWTPVAFAQPSLHDLPAWAQVRDQTPRRALVIGVGRYQFLPSLSQPDRDAAATTEGLRQLGFTVARPEANLGRDALLESFDRFLRSLSEGDIAVVYYSGHGVERGGSNYLIPADVQRLERGREGLVALDVEFLLNELQKRRVSVAIVVLDACRDDPLRDGAPLEVALVDAKGLAPVPVRTSGMFIGFAAAPRTVSWGGLSTDAPDRPSIFTRYLVEALPQEGKSLFWIWNQVGREVLRATSNQQRPWQNSSAFPELKLKPGPSDVKLAEQAWVQLITSGSALTLRDDLDGYLGAFPDSPFAPAARKKLRELGSTASAAAPGLAISQQSALYSALQDRHLVGAVAPASFLTRQSEFNQVTAAAELTIRAAPRPDAPEVAMVMAGSRLSALALPNQEGWLSVRLESGATGFVGSVQLTSRATSDARAELSFGAGIEWSSTANLNLLAPLISDARHTGGLITVDLGAAGEDLPDRARTTSFLRALAFRSALVGQGLRPEQVQLRFLQDPTRKDRAEVTLNH